MSSSCCTPTPVASDATVHDAVQAAYGAIAQGNSGCCAPSSLHLGYTQTQLDLLPQGADLGLGCGNPNALATLQPGERVLDLGCGAGIDVLLAAQTVGPEGQVIGVDMTPAMLAKARAHAVEAGVADRVDIRRGTIEALPVRDGEVDVVLSNCVINLSPAKDQVFREAFRALAPGGRLAVSDILVTEPLPPELQQNLAAWVGCLAGAPVADDYLQGLRDAGFQDIAWTRTPARGMLELAEAQGAVPDIGVSAEQRDRVGDTVFSYSITASKPAA